LKEGVYIMNFLGTIADAGKKDLW